MTLLMISLENPYSSYSAATKESSLALNYLVLLIAENVCLEIFCYHSS